MGSVVSFPDPRPLRRDGRVGRNGSATIVILPVVRIERHDGGPVGDAEKPGSGRKRRRRASRS